MIMAMSPCLRLLILTLILLLVLAMAILWNRLLQAGMRDLIRGRTSPEFSSLGQRHSHWSTLTSSCTTWLSFRTFQPHFFLVIHRSCFLVLLCHCIWVFGLVSGINGEWIYRFGEISGFLFISVYRCPDHAMQSSVYIPSQNTSLEYEGCKLYIHLLFIRNITMLIIDIFFATSCDGVVVSSCG